MNTIDPECKISNNYIKLDMTDSVNPIVSYIDKNMVVIDNVISEKEANYIIKYIDNNNGNHNNNRVKMNINCFELSDAIFNRCESMIPNNVYKYCSLLDNDHYNSQMYWTNPYINNSWRLVKCNPESFLSKHYDGVYVKSVDHKSIYTVMLYLNDTDGDIKFGDISISPKMGRLVIFDQQLLHEGLINKQLKYFIRSEIMYTRMKSVENENHKSAMSKYKQAILENSDELEKEAFELSPLLESLIINI